MCAHAEELLQCLTAPRFPAHPWFISVCGRGACARPIFMCGGRERQGRARSLVWLERPAHNRVIIGSNPVGPTSLLDQLRRELLRFGTN